MASSEDILKIAAGEIGYYAPDDPEPGSKYGRWMAELTGETLVRITKVVADPDAEEQEVLRCSLVWQPRQE